MNTNLIGVVGGGTLGTSIASLCMDKGFGVILKTQSEDNFKRIRNNIRSTKHENLCLTTEYSDLYNTRIVIECVTEDTGIKKEVLANIEKSCYAIIASNTSSLSINKLGKSLKHQDKFVGLHFFNPVDKMTIVEICPNNKTTVETISEVKEFVARLNKSYIIVPDYPGFVANRLLFPYLYEAVVLLDKGVSKEDIDTMALTAFNHPVGPLKLIDFIGVDVFVSVIKNLGYVPTERLLTMISNNKLGKKTKEGFYNYNENK